MEVQASEGSLAEPVRTCVACRGTDEQRLLLRLVADAAGRVRVDDLRREPGRGGYVHRRRACIEQLVRKPGSLGRSLKRNVVMTASVADELHRVALAAVPGVEGGKGNEES